MNSYACLKMLHRLFLLLLLAGPLSALELKDRLDEPSRTFNNVEKSAFLDVTTLGDRLLTIGERGVIAYSNDGGENWVQAKVPVSTMLTAMYFVDDTHGWAVGHSAVVLHTQDAGENWTLQFDGKRANELLLDGAKADYQALREEYDAADEEAQDDLSYDLDDAEFALSNAEFDSQLGPANPLLEVYFENKDKGYVVGAYGLFFATEDGGKTWFSMANRLENFDRYHLNSIAVLSTGAVLIVGEAGTMFASYDQGESWETLYSPYEGSFFGIQEVPQVKEVLIYGLKGNVYSSADEGQSWDKVATPATTNLTGSTIDENGVVILSGFSGVIVRSTDQGKTFSKVKQSGLEAYNAVATLKNSELVLVSDHGVHFQPY
ncbi:hypothetical protein A3755_01440 [Oleiphilus sp. HI0085]|nr:hypothetical protein A3755_01440 [Oleiphilus sp. HI0085]